MKILYLDLGMGASGDMLTSALAELLPENASFFEELNRVGIPDVKVTAASSTKCGITGLHTTVTVKYPAASSGASNLKRPKGQGIQPSRQSSRSCQHDPDSLLAGINDVVESESYGLHRHSLEPHHESAPPQEHAHSHWHHHNRMEDIHKIISALSVSNQVKKDVLSVYQLIAEAESHVHGKPVTEIHFHEIGMMDAIADITAVCMLMEKLSPDKVIASPVHVGSGQVHCAHGVLPVPAPATAYLLQGIPTCGDRIEGELCTPTGAALLRHFVNEYGPQPAMVTKAIGYGMGSKDFKAVNCIRALLGETVGSTDLIYELSCNVDDMTGEQIAFAMERLFEAGANEVYTQSIGMKKSRPGTLLRVLCNESVKDRIIRQIFKYTATIGIRENSMKRYTLDRTIEEQDTPWGVVHCKSCSGYGVVRKKYEYEDIARIAIEQNMTLEEVIKKLN